MTQSPPLANLGRGMCSRPWLVLTILVVTMASACHEPEVPHVTLDTPATEAGPAIAVDVLTDSKATPERACRATAPAR